MQKDYLQVSPEASDIGEACPYSGFCKHQEGCLPERAVWTSCWVYRSLEGLIDYMALLEKMEGIDAGSH